MFKQNARIGDGRLATIVVSEDGWGEGQPSDVAAICISVAETVFGAIVYDMGHEPTILVNHNLKGPKAISQRGPNGEFSIWLSAKDRNWSKVAYQFSHDREKNLVFAKALALQAHKNPEFYQAFHYLRRGTESQVNSMERIVSNWLKHCPAKLGFAPTAVSQLLGIGVNGEPFSI